MKKLLCLGIFLLFLIPIAMAVSEEQCTGTGGTCLLIIGEEYYYWYFEDGYYIEDSFGTEYSGSDVCESLGKIGDSTWYGCSTPSEAVETECGEEEECEWNSAEDLLSGIEIPEFTTITAGIALFGAGLSYFKLRRRY